ncbi:MAG: hypothetical protein IH898_12540, partial [Planctomycetes bacterium]|nr:hypothetical protein [Planctomycetota bacterium]
VAQEAWRIAVRFMTPVMILSDGYLANGSEPWRIPDLADLPKVEVEHPGPKFNNSEDTIPKTTIPKTTATNSCRTSATSDWPDRGPFRAHPV